MSAFTVELEQDAIVVMRLHGQWPLGTVESFRFAVRAVLARVPAGRQWFGLVDVTDHGIQSRDTADLLGRMGDAPRPPAATALVVSGAVLQAMQVRRVAPFANTRFFADETAARRWLDEQHRGTFASVMRSTRSDAEW